MATPTRWVTEWWSFVVVMVSQAVYVPRHGNKRKCKQRKVADVVMLHKIRIFETTSVPTRKNDTTIQLTHGHSYVEYIWRKEAGACCTPSTRTPPLWRCPWCWQPPPPRPHQTPWSPRDPSVPFGPVRPPGYISNSLPITIYKYVYHGVVASLLLYRYNLRQKEKDEESESGGEEKERIKHKWWHNIS